MKIASTLIGSLLVGFVTAQIPNYYNDVNLELVGEDLKNELADKISSNVTFLNYTSFSYDCWNAVQDGDENPVNSSEVVLLYGWENGMDGIATNDRTRDQDDYGNNAGDWNREHVFARSLASPPLTVDDPGPGTDVLNLRACDMQTNQNRSNLPFTDGSGNAGQVGNAWYPGDEWKGDVARIIFYMYVRYDGNGSSVSQTLCLPSLTGIGPSVSTDSNLPEIFLEWNAEDPVSEIEIQKNQIAEIRQGNRNPFVDNPALATLIWGGPPAEDTWVLIGSDFNPSSEVFTNGVLLSWDAPEGAVACQVKGGPEGGNDPASINAIYENPENIFVSASQLNDGVTYQWKVRCATGINPVQGLTDFSEYDVFTFQPNAKKNALTEVPTVPEGKTIWNK